MVSKGILFKDSGKFYHDDQGQIKQNKNTYYLYPSERLVKSEPGVIIENVIDDIDYGNWNEWKSKLTEHDIYLYWLQKDKNEEFSLSIMPSSSNSWYSSIIA